MHLESLIVFLRGHSSLLEEASLEFFACLKMRLWFLFFLLPCALGATVTAPDLIHEIVTTDSPASTDPDDVEFWLWTPENREKNDMNEVVFMNETSLEDSGYDPSRKSRIFIHGWGGDYLGQWILDGKNNFLDLSEYSRSSQNIRFEFIFSFS